MIGSILKSAVRTAVRKTVTNAHNNITRNARNQRMGEDRAIRKQVAKEHEQQMALDALDTEFAERQKAILDQ